MKSPTEYLDDAWQPYPEQWPAGGIPFVPMAQALAAVTQALADAERYKTNVVGAYLRSKSPTSPPAAQATSPNEQTH